MRMTPLKKWRDSVHKKSLYDICMEYPFLIPRNEDGQISMFAYRFIDVQIPGGWYPMFFQMCKDIKPMLEKEEVINDFYFIVVKEKFNFLRCFDNKKCSEKVKEVIEKYERMSRYICSECGAPAQWEATNYISSFCDECKKNSEYNNYPYTIQQLEQTTDYRKLLAQEDGTVKEETYSFKDIWDKYMEEFYGIR
jgi:hypothetical protein